MDISPRADLAAQVAESDWYHTLELAPGVVTPGWLDTRPIVAAIPFPESLEGMRCLDVGTFNGFWAFEMERRGAAEVVALDVLDPNRWDWPVGSDPETMAAVGERQAGGAGFEIAKRELGSEVQRVDGSVYDIDEAELGRFDLVYLGSLLIHLRDPVGALERVRSVCDGTLIVVDGIDPFLSLLRSPVAALDGRGRPWWWYPNVAALVRLIEAAGFELTGKPRRIYIPSGADRRLPRWSVRALLSREGRRDLVVAWRGDPHAVIAARPRAVAETRG